MTLRVARPCGCAQNSYMGQKRELRCECGNVFEKPGAGSKRARKGSTRKSSKPERYWFDALAKVEEEGCCRVCKRTDRKLDCAHILGSEHDEPMVRNGRILRTLYVHPDRIIPLCGPYPEGCHGAQHRHEIALLPHLTLTEQLQAVTDAGSIEAARIRLEPVTHRQEEAA